MSEETNKKDKKTSFQTMTEKTSKYLSPIKTSVNTKFLRKTKIKVGDICLLKISALSPKGIGIDEYSYPYSIFVPNTNLGDIVKVKIQRTNFKENKYAIAQVLEVVKKAAGIATTTVTEMLQSGETLTVNIEKLTSKAFAIITIKDSYKLIIPNATVGNNIKVAITRLKAKYGFAKIVHLNSAPSIQESSNFFSVLAKPIPTVEVRNEPGGFGSRKVKIEAYSLSSTYRTHFKNPLKNPEGFQGSSNEVGISKIGHSVVASVGKNPSVVLCSNSLTVKKNMLEGSKYTLTLPKIVASSNNIYSPAIGLRKFVVVRIDGSVVFIKLSLGAKPGSKVRIKITKLNNKFALAKIIQINPISLLKKRILIQNSIRQMVKNGMHLGEKAVKCNARMKNYVWLKKQGQNKNRPLIKKGRHIINLFKTRRCLNKALTQLSKYAFKGRTFLFIGTKKPAAGLIARASLFSKTSFFVNTRWLGGMLTNWKTILKSISKIRPILKEKQKIVADILEKRQTIKLRLIKKALLLKKKSKLILSKGRFLIDQFKNPQSTASMLVKAKKLSLKRKQLVENCYSLLSKRQVLIAKRRELMYQSIVLKEHAKRDIISPLKTLLKQYFDNKKLRELKYLLLLSNEIKKIKNKARLENKEILNISYGKIKDLRINNVILPNPPKEILNLILLTLKNSFAKNQISYGLSPALADLLLAPATVLAKPTSSFSSLLRFVPNQKQEGVATLCVREIPTTVGKDTKRKKNPEGGVASIRNEEARAFLWKERSEGIRYLQSQETDINKITAKTNIMPLKLIGQKVLVVSKLVSKFSRFEPYLKELIKTYEQNIITPLKNSLTNLAELLIKIKTTLRQYVEFKNLLAKELNVIKMKLIAERNIIRIVKNKLKHFTAQKRLIKFLPRLRYLATPLFTHKISETVKILMKKIVDPKLKYPVDNIYDDKLSNNTKKIAAARKKKWQRLEKYFGGISNMTKMTKSQISKNVAIVVGQKEEMNAVHECKKLGIKMFNIVDTNCNPSLADHIIPANDDSRNSIKYVLNKFLVRIRLAQKLRKKISQKLSKKVYA